MASLHSSERSCPVCGGACKAFPDVQPPVAYPFLPGGADLMADDQIIAPHRIIDHELGRVVYGTGQPVPYEDAVKYGLVTEKKAPAKKAAPRPKGKRAPAEDRAAKPTESRARKAAKKR